MSETNPYKRLVKLKQELEPLELEEEFMNKKGLTKYNKRTIQQVKNEIFFLVIEMIPIENSIKYFEKIIDKLKKRLEGQKVITNLCNK